MKNKYSVILAICFFVSLAFLTASQDKNPQWKGTVEKKDGIRIIKNPKEPLYGEITLELEEDLSIGNEKDENYIFNLIVDINVDMDGNVYAVDFKEKHIQVYDKFGKHVTTIGRAGQGPGEFQNPSCLHIDSEGSLYVQEMYRLNQFYPSGEFKRSMTIGNPTGYQLTQLAILEGGKILAKLHKYTEEGTVSKIALLDNSAKEIKTIVEYPPYKLEPIINERIVPLWNPYNFFLMLSSYVKGYGIYSYSEKYELVIVNSSGEKVLIIRKDESPSAVTEKEKDLVVNKNFKIFSENPLRKNRYNFSKNEIKKLMMFPNHKPYFSNIITDEEGNIYVIKLNSSIESKYGVIIDYFNSVGEYLYRFVIRDINPVLFKNKHIYTVESDQNTGFSIIKRYKIKNWKQIKK